MALANVFGILGNVISFLVYLAPLPTFIRIYKRKSTEGFHSIPYAVALFSAMLTLYYGILKSTTLLITINSIGIAIESSYLVIFLIYATRESKINSWKLLILLNVGAFGIILFSTLMFPFDKKQRVNIVGWICAGFSVCVFIAPLSIMRLVIRTKSVEYMPFSLSFFLTLCAVVWFFYGLLIKDKFVATPNVVGFAFGIVQMGLYMLYKDTNKKATILPIAHTDLELQQQQDINNNDTKTTSTPTEQQQQTKPAADENDSNIIVVIVVEDEKEAAASCEKNTSG